MTLTGALVCALWVPMALSMKLQGAGNPHMTLAAVDSPHMTLATVDAPHMTLAVVGANAKQISEISKLASVFDRSDGVHQQTMEEISKSLTLPEAMKVLQNDTLDNPSLKQVMGLITGGQQLRAMRGKGDDSGFGGIDGARKLLNDMIYESMTKYDAEIAKCTDYYAKQCALMEVARGQISAANFQAATSRNLILDAQANIQKAQKDIPVTKKELGDHNKKCSEELHRLNNQLKEIMGDISVMTMILTMTDCDAKFLQMDKFAMLRCEDQCSKKTNITFNHVQLQDEVNQLQSPTSKELVEEGFAELFSEGEEVGAMQLVQVQGSDYQELVSSDEQDPKKVKKMLKKPKKMKQAKFKKPPMPMVAVPPNPCSDPNMGAPSAANKRAAKCTLKKSPQCYKLQGRFLQIQGGIADQRDEMMDQISKMEAGCKETKQSLEASIDNDNSVLSASQTKLAAATEKEAAAGEQARQVSAENEQYNMDLLKQMKTCSGNYVNFETELCALKKIRGDLFKKFKPGHKGFFQDCEVSPWTPEACTKKCKGGEQKLTRTPLKHPDGGAKCLPLAAKRRCNRSPCPVDCKLAQWSGWSKCSAKCGGGVSQRVRDVKVAMRYDGKPCSATSETQACNVAACEKNCKLRKWTKWTTCSKDCDGGSMKRVRMVKEAAEGAGTCAGEWTKDRLQYKDCNMFGCKIPDPKKVMKCQKSLDIMLLLDGTPKSGPEAWKAQVKAANLFVDAFAGKGVKAKPLFSVVHYTGPRTWSGVSKCTGKSKKKVDMVKTCKVKIAQHFDPSVAKTKGIINGLQFTPGTKLLSLALMTAQSEFALGRANRRSIVVVFMDGEPLSYRKTLLTSLAIRKKARLVYVVVNKFAPLGAIKKWASRRWQENLIAVKSIKDLAKPETGTHLVANLCPKEYAKLKAKGPKRKKR